MALVDKNCLSEVFSPRFFSKFQVKTPEIGIYIYTKIIKLIKFKKNMIKKLTFLLIGLLVPFMTIQAQNWIEFQRFFSETPYENSSDSYLGQAIAIDGDYMVISSFGKRTAAVYYNNGTTWETSAVLTASDGVKGDYFGYSVSISGDNIVVGAFNSDTKGAVYVYTKPTTGWIDMTQTAKITASDGIDYDYFGYSVSISGDNIVVGAKYNIGTGSAYVFTKPATGWTNNTETAKLTASDGADYDCFGHSVSISGENIVIGTYLDDDNGESSGSAYIFTKPATGWGNMTQTAKLIASDGAESDYFGNSVSISGDDVVVGAYNSDGSAYVFTKPAIGWTNMTQTAILTNNSAYNSFFGYSVSISGDNIIIGDGKPYSCYQTVPAYIYTKPATGWVNMNQTAELDASDILDWPCENYGATVCISGDNIGVGARGDNSNGYYSGAVYTFLKPGATWSNATENQKITPSLFFNNIEERFGEAVSIDGDYAVVGAVGSQRAYVLYYTGTNWSQIAILTATDVDIDDNFGNSVSISGDNIIVGANNENSVGHNNGAAYVFSKPASGWTDMSETAKLMASDAAQLDYFGYSVGISGDDIVIGGRFNGGSRVYVFTKPVNGWINMTETVILSASDGVDYYDFGRYVDIFNDNIVVSSKNPADEKAVVYVFKKPLAGWSNATQIAKLSVTEGSVYTSGSSSVCINEDNIILGAKLIDGRGAVYVFTKSGNDWADMMETAVLTSSDGTANDYFGSSIDISGDNIVVGAPYNNIIGSAYVFIKPVAGWLDMQETAKLTPSNGISYLYAQSVSISENNILIGDWEDSDENNRGTISVFTNDPTYEVTISDNIDFTIPENVFAEIPADERIFTITLADGSPLPDWLIFDEETLTFSGTAPTSGVVLDIIITVSNNGKIILTYEFTLIITETTNIFHVTKNNAFSVYPNPTSGIMNFKFTESNIQKITISDITGKVIIYYR